LITLLHELAHLFSTRWNETATPLLSEGLSVWLQEKHFGQPIDPAVRPLLADRRLKLRSLLDRGFFFSEPQRAACYVVAGSFTGFPLMILLRESFKLTLKNLTKATPSAQMQSDNSTRTKMACAIDPSGGVLSVCI